MPTWDEILNEVGSASNILDVTRRKYITELSDYTNRNTIIYYSAFLQKQSLVSRGVDFSINDNDKNGFMTVVNKLDKSKGLDLLLHTPGGNVSATESIVHYLKKVFGNDIRAIVPQIAMSAGTMIACSCKSIVMGKQSNLGPIDPQFRGIPAHGIVEEFERIMDEVKKDNQKIIVWREILRNYSPTLIGECEKAIKWSESMVSNWLKENMFFKDPDKDDKVDKEVVDDKEAGDDKVDNKVDDKEANDIKYDNVEKSLNGFKKHVQKIMNEKVSEEELNGAKLRIKNKLLNSIESSASQTVVLSDTKESIYGPAATAEKLKLIDTITPEDIQNAAKYIFSRPSVTTVIASEDTLKNSSIKSTD